MGWKGAQASRVFMARGLGAMYKTASGRFFVEKWIDAGAGIGYNLLRCFHCLGV